MDYSIKNTENIVSPALVYYKDMIEVNLDKIIRLAGGADRLWPHVKTHKCLEMTKLQIRKGIRRFKCATIAELEMVCMAKADAGILAMPPAGPTVDRLIAVKKAYPDTQVFGIVDCEEHLRAYSAAARREGVTVDLLLDVNMGMNRTGVPTAQAAELYRKASAMPGLHMWGLHCYDGNRHETSVAERQACVDRDVTAVLEVRHALRAEGYGVEYMVMGGSPSLPCHIHYAEDGMYYSLGTIFLNDIAYLSEFPDLQMEPAATILCRVISHPCRGRFTLDCGYKGIAGDPPAPDRGRLIGVEHCRPVLQSEEHWVFQMDEGHEDEAPAVGTTVYAVPRHVCPCALLYPSILIAEGGEITGEWDVTARNRKINF